MTTEDGSLLIKPASSRELAFYQLLQAESTPALATLRRFTPKFLGTLTLEGEAATGTSGELAIKPASDRKESLVLENLSHKFIRPNILDIKLGTVLHDDDAPPEKVERMRATARNTTSLETGVRLTGFQVHDNATKQAVNTPKTYGKSIKAADLPDGIARFFPAAHPGAGADTEDGRFGLPPRVLLTIITAVRAEIAQIRGALAGIEMRMVGGSLLVVYEADWERAESGIAAHLAAPAEGEAQEDDEDEDDEDDDEEEGPGPAFVVKLIDFAHTKVEEGLGPAEGVLLGVDTVLRLLDGRIAEIKEKYAI